MKKEHEVISNRKMSDREKELWEELQKLAKFMYEKFPEYETTNDESFVHKAIRIIVDLKSQLAECKEHYDYQAHLVNSLYKQISDLIDENKALEKQLASVKYLNADEVKRILSRYIISSYYEDYVDEDDIVSAICNLAIDIDRDKIIEVLDSRFKTQLRTYLIEFYSVTGKLTEKQENDIKDYMKKSADEIIEAIRKD